MSLTKKELISNLESIGCFEVRDDDNLITLKSGKKSKLYLDLRKTFAYPNILDEISSHIYSKILNKYARFDEKTLRCTLDSNFVKDTCICGLPYGAMPLASALSLKSGLGLILLRKEAKGHGTKRLIEGMMDTYKRVIIIDDVLTSGLSISECIGNLDGMFSEMDVFVVCDRFGERNKQFQHLLDNNVISVNSLFNIYDLPELYSKNEVFKNNVYQKSNVHVQKLVNLMHKKQSALIVSLDQSNPRYALDIIRQVGDSAICVKFHYDVIDFSDYNEDIWFETLRKLSEEFDFCVFEDRKFMDIGNTVKLQSKNIMKKYKSLNFMNAVMVAGESVVNSLEPFKDEFSLLLLAEMSSKNNLFDEKIISKTLDIAHSNKFVGGLICQSRKKLKEMEYKMENTRNDLLYMTPGVNLSVNGDSDGQCYRTVRDAMIRDECDIIIVGRGITYNSNPRDVAEQYRKESWACYLEKNK